MPQYEYKAITKEGLVVRNRVESPSKQTLIKALKSSELQPIDIIQFGYKDKEKEKEKAANAAKGKKKGAAGIDEIMEIASNSLNSNESRRKQSAYERINMALSVHQKVTVKDLKVFTENFYLLKKANFNNIHALSTIIKSTENMTFRGILEEILSGVEAGEYMYTTMEYYANIFPFIYTNMIKVGELSGSLTQTLEQARKYLDSTSDLSRKLKGILIPNILQFVVLLVLLFVGTLYTVPTIQGVYDAVGTEEKLPELTVKFSEFLQWMGVHWYLFVIAIGLIAVIIWAYIQTPRGRYNYDYFKYKMPVLGKLNYRIDFSRLMKAMSLNLENGMRIQESLDICKNVVDNYVMRAMIETAINNMLAGNSWIDPFENSGLTSGMTIEMLKVGMQTNLTEMMTKLLDYIEIEINQTMNAVMALLPQITYSVVGILLIFVVLIVLVPCINVYMGNFLFSAAGL